MSDCCDNLSRALEDNAILQKARGTIADGRILNDIFSDFYIRMPGEGHGYRYYAINFCPFCGRSLSAASPDAQP
ncbi:MAG: hypothetical protein HY232_07320 [Acidobacteria bacterium]|nr:hypothetical protein [Acidobacteriota bacterium]